MAKQTLPKAYLWKEREVKDWNTDTFLAYMKDLHKEKLNIEYVSGTGGIMREKGMINTFRKKHGNDILKEFITNCFHSYTPKPEHPNLTFWFMKTYMEGSQLPKLLLTQSQEKQVEKYEEQTKKLTTDEMLDLL